MAARAPRPSGCGDEGWKASLLSPTPSNMARGVPLRSTSANAAPSPMFMPGRSALKGMQGPSAMTPRLKNPRTVVWQSASAPPTSTASARPASSRRRAEAKTLPLDEQAVLTMYAGPLNPPSLRQMSVVMWKGCCVR
jgi:hypothetical protein